MVRGCTVTNAVPLIGKNDIPGAPLIPANPSLRYAEQKQLRNAPIILNREQRDAIHCTIQEVCAYRGWELHEINVRTNHVHVVISAGGTPEKVMNNLKSRATRRLRERRLLSADAELWSRHGSTGYLWKEIQVAEACRYVLEAQDDVKPEE